MAINNLNPRRTVWFSPHEPSNKYDIWLSKNAHYDENGESTTDSNAQRDCDYIFKIYDCGKWNPIVGFNSTAANKINVVKGTQFSCTTTNGYNYTTPTDGYQRLHVPLFRELEDSPTELFDAGTLGEVILKYVTGSEWGNIFDSNWFINAFNTHIIGGNDYNWSTLISNLISNGDVQIPFADEDTCGGIYSATHSVVSSAFKPIEVKFYPEVQGYYQNEQHRLCVSASDVIEQINSYYNDNPSGSSININWNSTTIHQLAEVIQGIFKNSSSIGFEDTWSIASDPHVYPHIWGVNSSNAGKFLRINPTWNPEGTGWSQSNNNMDWVLKEDIFPELSTTNTDDNLYVVRGFGVQGVNQKMKYLLCGVGKWMMVGSGITTIYDSIDQEYIMRQHIQKQNEIEIDTVESNNIKFSINTTPQGDEIVNAVYNSGVDGFVVNQYQYLKVTISTQTTLLFENISQTEYTNPIRIKIIAEDNLNLSFTNTKYICESNNQLTTLPKGTEWLLTFQFGVVKFEEIITPQ